MAADPSPEHPVPVTAKFSRDFYDRFGHDAVDELVNFLNRIDAGNGGEVTERSKRNVAGFGDEGDRRFDESKDGVKAALAATERRLVSWMLILLATVVLGALVSG